MGSPLSMRLGYPRSVSSDTGLIAMLAASSGTTPSSNSTARQQQQATSCSAPGSLSGSNAVETGYSADRESNSSSVPPLTIDFLSRHRKRQHDAAAAATGAAADTDAPAAKTQEQANKRLKMQEMNYRAATAKTELKRSGLKVPTLKFDVNHKGVVNHVYSNAVAESPFLVCTNNNTSAPPTATANASSSNASIGSNGSRRSIIESALSCGVPHYTDPMAAMLGISDLIESCQHFYKALPKDIAAAEQRNNNNAQQQGKGGEGDESSTSSFTDTESNSSGDDDAAAKSTYVSMGEALAISKKARIVTLSSAPFTIVHVNAAFTRVTGMSSVKTLGRPFGDLIQNTNNSTSNLLLLPDDQQPPPPLLEILKDCANTLSSTVVAGQGIKSRNYSRSNKGGYIPCSVNVSPVGTPYQSATHLAMELQLTSSSTENNNDDVGGAVVVNTAAVASSSVASSPSPALSETGSVGSQAQETPIACGGRPIYQVG